MDRSPSSARTCLAWARRERGQNRVPLPPATIQDVIWVPQNTEAVIRMRFKQWKGKSVYHCHILPHEDTGMMQNFLIRGAQTFETADGRPPRH